MFFQFQVLATNAFLDDYLQKLDEDFPVIFLRKFNGHASPSAQDGIRFLWLSIGFPASDSFACQKTTFVSEINDMVYLGKGAYLSLKMVVSLQLVFQMVVSPHNMTSTPRGVPLVFLNFKSDFSQKRVSLSTEGQICTLVLGIVSYSPSALPIVDISHKLIWISLYYKY